MRVPKWMYKHFWPPVPRDTGKDANIVEFVQGLRHPEKLRSFRRRFVALLAGLGLQMVFIGLLVSYVLFIIGSNPDTNEDRTPDWDMTIFRAYEVLGFLFSYWMIVVCHLWIFISHQQVRKMGNKQQARTLNYLRLILLLLWLVVIFGYGWAESKVWFIDANTMHFLVSGPFWFFIINLLLIIITGGYCIFRNTSGFWQMIFGPKEERGGDV